MSQHPQNRNQSEIRRLMETIGQEYQSAYLGLSGLNVGTSMHEFITARMERIGVAGKQLVELVGEDTAGRLIVEQMSKATEGESNS